MAQDGWSIDAEKFVEWAERQTENSQCVNARLISNGYEQENCVEYHLRLRESIRDSPEDIVLLKTESADAIRFEYGSEVRQFLAHRRKIEFTEKTISVKTKDGKHTICTAGTGGRRQRGPFPL